MDVAVTFLISSFFLPTCSLQYRLFMFSSWGSLFVPGKVYFNASLDVCTLCLGNRKWTTAGFPLKRIRIEDEDYCYMHLTATMHLIYFIFMCIYKTPTKKTHTHTFLFIYSYVIGIYIYTHLKLYVPWISLKQCSLCAERGWTANLVIKHVPPEGNQRVLDSEILGSFIREDMLYNYIMIYSTLLKQ